MFVDVGIGVMDVGRWVVEQVALRRIAHIGLRELRGVAPHFVGDDGVRGVHERVAVFVHHDGPRRNRALELDLDVLQPVHHGVDLERDIGLQDLGRHGFVAVDRKADQRELLDQFMPLEREQGRVEDDAFDVRDRLDEDPREMRVRVRQVLLVVFEEEFQADGDAALALFKLPQGGCLAGGSVGAGHRVGRDLPAEPGFEEGTELFGQVGLAGWRGALRRGLRCYFQVISPEQRDIDEFVDDVAGQGADDDLADLDAGKLVAAFAARHSGIRDSRAELRCAALSARADDRCPGGDETAAKDMRSDVGSLRPS